MSFPPEGHRHSGRQNLDQRSRSLCRLKVLDLSTKPPACYLTPMGYCITSYLWRRPSRIDRLAAFPTVEISRLWKRPWFIFGVLVSLEKRHKCCRPGSRALTHLESVPLFPSGRKLRCRRALY